MKKSYKSAKLSMVAAGLIAASAIATTNEMYIIGGSGISTLDVTNPYGVISAPAIAPITSGISSSAIVATPYNVAHKFTYIANSDGSISVFKPDAKGELIDQKLSLTSQKKINFMATDSKGLHLYATNPDNNTVSIYGIDAATGALTLQSSVATNGSKPNSIALGSNRAIVTNRDSNTITMYLLDANTGNLTSPSTANVGVHPIIAHILKGKFVQVLNEGNNGASTISQFSLPETGSSLVSLQPAQVSVSANAHLMVARNDEKYIFVTSGRSDHKDSIQVLAVTDSGTLTPIQTMIGNTTGGESSSLKRSLSIDPRDQTIYAANPEIGRVAAYKIESTGKIAAEPVTTLTAANVQAMDVNPSTGEENPIVITDEVNGSVHVKTNKDVVFDVKNSNFEPYSDTHIEFCVTYSHAHDGGPVEMSEVCNDNKITTDGSSPIYTYTLSSNECEGNISYANESGPNICKVKIHISVAGDLNGHYQELKVKLNGKYVPTESSVFYSSAPVTVEDCESSDGFGQCGGGEEPNPDGGMQ